MTDMHTPPHLPTAQQQQPQMQKATQLQQANTAAESLTVEEQAALGRLYNAIHGLTPVEKHMTWVRQTRTK